MIQLNNIEELRLKYELERTLAGKKGKKSKDDYITWLEEKLLELSRITQLI